MADLFEFSPNSILDNGQPGVVEIKDINQEDIFDLKPNSENTDSGEDDKNLNPPTPDNIKGEDVFSVVLGQDLKERGILSEFDQEAILKIAKEQDDASAIAELIRLQIEASQNEIKSKYEDGYKEYLELLHGGVPKEEALEIRQLESFASSVKQLDLKSDNDDAIQARKDLLTLNYRLTTKWPDEKIQKYVDKIYNEGSDIDEIDEALGNVESYISEEKQNALNLAKEKQESVKKTQEKYLSDVNSYVDKVNEFFEGDKITQEVKNKMKKLITTPVKLDNGQVVSQLWVKRNEDPVGFDTKMAYLHAIGFFDGKAGDRFIKAANTKAASGLQNWLTDNKGRNYGSSLGKSFNSKSGSTDPLDAALGL